jgi:hypothetical protein
MLQKTHTYDDSNNDVFWQIFDEMQNKCSDKMTVYGHESKDGLFHATNFLFAMQY